MISDGDPALYDVAPVPVALLQFLVRTLFLPGTNETPWETLTRVTMGR